MWPVPRTAIRGWDHWVCVASPFRDEGSDALFPSVRVLHPAYGRWCSCHPIQRPSTGLWIFRIAVILQSDEELGILWTRHWSDHADRIGNATGVTRVLSDTTDMIPTMDCCPLQLGKLVYKPPDGSQRANLRLRRRNRCMDGGEWWTRRDLNARHLRCERSDLPG